MRRTNSTLLVLLVVAVFVAVVLLVTDDADAASVERDPVAGLALIDSHAHAVLVWQQAVEDARNAAIGADWLAGKAELERRADEAAAAPMTRPTAPGSSGLNATMQAIAPCEGGQTYLHRDHGHSTSSASGKFGFLDSTWRGLPPGPWSAYSRAMHAPEWVQDAAAMQLYSTNGTQPWSESRGCWG